VNLIPKAKKAAQFKIPSVLEKNGCTLWVFRGAPGHRYQLRSGDANKNFSATFLLTFCLGYSSSVMGASKSATTHYRASAGDSSSYTGKRGERF
jgi:hypothetical protein